ncbi:MAG: TolC family protein [Paludibacteraceae bacterium]
MRSLLLTLSFISASMLCAQQALTLDEAIHIALKNNYGIQVAENAAEVAKANNTSGNAGMLPTVGVIGGANYALNDTYQRYSEGSNKTIFNLSTTNLNAAVQLSWTLFDGGKMFVTKEKLTEIERLGSLEYKNKVLSTTYDVILAYYDVVRQKQQFLSIQEMLNYNNERVKIAETGYNAGSMLKSDMLQAKIDKNITSGNLINQEYVIKAAKKQLNLLLARNPEAELEVVENITMNFTFDKDYIEKKLYENNTDYLMLKKQSDIAKLILKENERAYIPTFDLKGGYYYNQTFNSAGTTLNNRVLGPQVGGTLSIPLYTAGESKRKTTVAKLDILNTQYNLDQLRLKLNVSLQNALQDLENQQKLLQIETENNALTKENLEMSLQRLRYGQATSLEVHQAQEYFVQSSTRLINFKYNLKISETKLKQLIAEL